MCHVSAFFSLSTLITEIVNLKFHGFFGQSKRHWDGFANLNRCILSSFDIQLIFRGAVYMPERAREITQMDTDMYITNNNLYYSGINT